MKKLLSVFLIINSLLLSGCWNYREIEQLSIVSGVAVDKDEEGKLMMTAEIIDIGAGGKEGEIKPVYIEMDGYTFFDTARAAVLLTGKRLYWSHCKVIILSKDIANDDPGSILDFVIRDTEVREDMWVVISREKTAKELLWQKPAIESITGLEIDSMMRSQESVSWFPVVQVHEFANRLKGNKEAAFLPSGRLKEIKDKKSLEMAGAAIFAEKKIVGWIDGLNSKYLLWLRDELKGGLYVMEEAAGTETDVTLEIYRSKTEVKPLVSGEEIRFDINIKPIVYIGEIKGNTDFISEKGRAKLKKAAEEKIKKEAEEFIRKVQQEYRTDVFGFGKKLEKLEPEVWKSIKEDWKEVFPEVETSVRVDVEIRGSSTRKKPVVAGE